MPLSFPKLGPGLDKRKGNFFAKKKPKTRNSILIALGLGILVGSGYLISERVNSHEKEREAFHNVEVAKTREKIKATTAVGASGEEDVDQDDGVFDL